MDERLVQEAIREEPNYLNATVWEITDASKLHKLKDPKVVRSRWVLCNKGDAANPNLRARLVACECNTSGTKEASFYASTPPLEAKKLLFRKYTDRPIVNGKPMRLSFVDIKKAYFNGIPKRNVLMRLPKELGLPSDQLGLQVRCMGGDISVGPRAGRF